MKTIFKTLRINNWVKNFIVVLPVFFAGKILKLNNTELLNLFHVFVAFCLASSFIYIINDLKDIEKDKLHPTKSKRPIASGSITRLQIAMLVFSLILLSTLIAALMPFKAFIFIIGYVILNLFYCFGMKNIAIIDVSSISLGFVFRVLAGGFVTNTTTTHWIIILVFLLMFSIAIAKRRDDLVITKNNTMLFRKAQSDYSIEFIDIAKTISFTITLMAYIIYSVSEDVINRFDSEYVYITSLPVFLGIMRYIQLTVVFKKSGSPVDLLLKDKFIIATIFAWIALFIFIIYG
jgi:4-hydroxybenzoate polyprenyltransferase